MFNPTPEQSAIVEAARTQSNNLQVIARAGAAKTTTLVMIAEALPEEDILCLAFNKKIATEMTERLPANCEAKTLHALGYKAWFQFIRKNCTIDDRKIYNLTKARIEKLSPDDRKEGYETMSETMDFIRTGKNVGYLPDDFKGHWKPLVNDADFFGGLELEPSSLQMSLIRDVSAASFRLALDGQLDFSDMVLCPALCQVSWPAPSLTLVDEAQDLSALNHHMLKKIVKNRRLIAVGDPCQAIYGFRGADEHSMSTMQTRFTMEPLYLTVSFRCAKAVIRNARWRAADMQYPDWAAEGTVERLRTWSLDDVSDNDAIICRNNAPLFTLAIKLIQNGQMPELSGRDIGAPLKKIMKKLGKPSLVRLAALDALADWEDKEMKRARGGMVGAVKDRAECIRIFLEKTENLGDATAYLDSLLRRDGRIYLMTGHKSKGQEFDTVWFLDPHLINKEKNGQDANVQYVIETRAKETLRYVRTDGLEDE